MLTGLILTDGPNQSLDGAPKALLPFAGDTLIQCQIREMNKICEEIIVVTQEPKSFYRLLDLTVRIITNYFPGKGPLSSIHAGLSLAQLPDVWIVESGMPFLSATAAELLWNYKRNNCHAVIPSVDGVTYPLCGIYDKRCASKAYALLSNGETSVKAFLKELDWEEFPEKILKNNGAYIHFLFHIDSHAKYKEALLLSRN